jgi:hypothetical protein
MTNKKCKLICGTEQLTLNGTVEFPVTIEILCEDDQFNDGDIDFETEDEKQKFLRDIDRGHISCLHVTVLAKYSEFHGRDDLGKVYAKSPQEVEDIVKEYDMINSALIDLKHNMRQSFETLKSII